MKPESSYNQIVKSTSIFGSSQLVNVVFGIVRSKFTAVLLGTMGVGIFGIFQSVIDVVRSVSGLGLDAGATKKLAVMQSAEEGRVGKTLYTINLWYLLTALIGALVCVIFAKPLSFWAFESYHYTPYIAALSITVFFISLNAGITASLQGLRRIKYMAAASTLSSFVTLAVMLPVYYFWRIEGIVPMFIIGNILTFFISLFFYKKLKIKPIQIPTREALRNGKPMLRLGLFIVIAGILSTGSLFVVRAYINRMEGIHEVGLFQAAWVCTTLLWGIILRSANTDFFPKLCSLVDDASATKRFVNEQTHVILLIISPILIGLIVFAEYVLHILYTSEFIEASNLLIWHLIGAFFKMAITPLATIILAKNRGGIHLLCESIFWGTYLVSIYFLYPFFNIEATGMAYLIAYLIYVPAILIASYRLSKSRWDWSTIGLVVLNIVFFAILYVSYHLWDKLFIVGSVCIVVSSLISLSYLKKVINLKEIIRYIKDRL